MKRRLLLDTNVVLDVLLNREPHVATSAAVIAAIERGKAKGFLAAHAVTTIHYLATRQLRESEVRETLRTLLTLFEVAPVDGRVLKQALQSAESDFEDVLTASAAWLSGCHVIVTRDPKGFRRSAVRAYHPEAILPV